MKKPYKEIKRVGIVANSGKPASRTIVQEAVQLVKRAQRAVLCDLATAQLAELDITTCASTADLAEKVDVLLVFGGDGTMLRAAREINGSRTPLLGINIGALGFLTDVPSSDLAKALKNLWSSQFMLESRAMIQAVADARGHKIRSRALNDIVVSRSIVSRLIELEVYVDGEMLTRYRCDGLIVSSPTGSTAYSLAAGGAVVYPTAEVFTITPICPHTLSNRSVIVGLDSTIEVKVVSERPETILSADGQNESALSAGDTVKIDRCEHAIRLVHLNGVSFFKTLRHKLHWTGSNIRETR